MGVRDCSVPPPTTIYIYYTNNFIPILYTTNNFIYIYTSTSTTTTSTTSKHKHHKHHKHHKQAQSTAQHNMISEVDRELSIRVLRLCAQRQRQGLQPDDRKLPLQTLRPQKRRSFSPVEVCGIVLRREDAVFRPISIAHNNTCYASHKKRKRASTTEVLGAENCQLRLVVQ